MSAWAPEHGYAATLRLMAEHPDLTALIAANDNVAFGIYQALTELRRAIPGDVSVISFDDELLATYLRPQVTTLRLPYLEMGEIGAARLLDLIEAPVRHASESGSLKILGPMPLIERGSVATLPK